MIQGAVGRHDGCGGAHGGIRPAVVPASPAHHAGPLAAHADPRGRYLASACRAQSAEAATIWVWDTERWTGVAQLAAHTLTGALRAATAAVWYGLDSAMGRDTGSTKGGHALKHAPPAGSPPCLQSHSWPSAPTAASSHLPAATAPWRCLSGSRRGMAQRERRRSHSGSWRACPRPTPASCGACTGLLTLACWPPRHATGKVSRECGVACAVLGRRVCRRRQRAPAGP